MTQNPFQTPSAQDPFVAAPASARGNDGRLDIGQAISDAWQTMTANAGLAIGGMLLTMLLMALGYVTIIGIILVLPVLGYGAIRLYLNLCDGGGEIGDLFEGFRNYGSALGPMLMVGLVFLGLAVPVYALFGLSIYLEMPALSWLGQLVYVVVVFGVSPRLYFAPFFIVDQGMGGIDAVRAAWEATADQKLIAFALILVASIIGMAGMIALFIGLLFTMPLCYLIYTHAYRQLAGVS